MTVDEIIKYVMETPHNTNKAVLKPMLESLAGEGGEGGESETDLSKLLTSHVTITNTGDHAATIQYPAVKDNEPTMIATTTLEANGSVTIDTFPYANLRIHGFREPIKIIVIETSGIFYKQPATDGWYPQGGAVTNPGDSMYVDASQTGGTITIQCVADR